jgi:hypothetical protein
MPRSLEGAARPARVKIRPRSVDKKMARAGRRGDVPQKERKAEKARNKDAENGVNPAPAPVLTAMGLNDNLDFMGRQLHVQTENLRSPSPCIVTQVFCNGRVLFSTKSEYLPGVNESQDFSRIGDLMQSQHYRVIEKIRDKKAQILSKS